MMALVKTKAIFFIITMRPTLKKIQELLAKSILMFLTSFFVDYCLPPTLAG